MAAPAEGCNVSLEGIDFRPGGERPTHPDSNALTTA